MPAPVGISGKHGYAKIGSSIISEFTDWTGTLDKGLQNYNAYSGGGWQKSVVGNKKFSGTINGMYDTNYPVDAVLDTDELVVLELHMDAGDYYYGYARMGNITYTVNSNTGAIESWSCQFESHGIWTHATN